MLSVTLITELAKISVFSSRIITEYWVNLKKKKKSHVASLSPLHTNIDCELASAGWTWEKKHACSHLLSSFPPPPPSCDLAQRFEWSWVIILHVSLWSIMYRYKSKGMNHSSAPFWTDCAWNCATVKSDRDEKSKRSVCNKMPFRDDNAHFAAVMKTRRVGYLSVNY